ncbi:Lysosomal Pro-X carboxypeptidase [Armadillidium nasatum]|uniref:Lysosomal Pro-X carboxypeptidase n=1 Tax=Armadillidium nasatum TaxID=96803 RepID=A0A5N5T8D0_9CRUS|nr:Lysosomal Pro-X carboxypeptidase [Armadillidium nasatum]
MVHMMRPLTVLFLFFTTSSVISLKYRYKTYYYKQQVDHFGFTNVDKFPQRYLFCDESWNKNGGPIFFYCGNEGDISLFAENTGFNTTYSGYLTSEQALADYADLINHIKSTVKGAEKSPVIVFGGSYGGMLASWFRMKYPHIVDGAIAASAPILQFVGMTPCGKFGQVVTKDFTDQSKACSEGIKWINENWKLCRPLKNKEDLSYLKEFLTNVYGNLAMADYPYPASFLAPLPANPIMRVCEFLKHPNFDSTDFLLELFDGISVYFNYTKTARCLDHTKDASSLLGDEGWDFQACTEMVMPFCYDGKSDFFEPTPWNFTEYSEMCYSKWKVMPRPLMPEIQYGGSKIRAASNIVFSNGLLDPWSTGGVLKNLTDSLIAVNYPGRSSSPGSS